MGRGASSASCTEPRRRRSTSIATSQRLTSQNRRRRGRLVSGTSKPSRWVRRLCGVPACWDRDRLVEPSACCEGVNRMRTKISSTSGFGRATTSGVNSDAFAICVRPYEDPRWVSHWLSRPLTDRIGQRAYLAEMHHAFARVFGAASVRPPRHHFIRRIVPSRMLKWARAKLRPPRLSVAINRGDPWSNESMRKVVEDLLIGFDGRQILPFPTMTAFRAIMHQFDEDKFQVVRWASSAELHIRGKHDTRPASRHTIGCRSSGVERCVGSPWPAVEVEHVLSVFCTGHGPPRPYVLASWLWDPRTRLARRRRGSVRRCPCSRSRGWRRRCVAA
jgi:hypothetical protein